MSRYWTGRYWMGRILRLALPVLGILSYYIGIHDYCQLRAYPDAYQIVCGGETSLTKADYENIQETQEKEESACMYALWGKTDGMEVEEMQWGRRSSVAVWKVRGDLEVLFTGSARLLEQDLQGCYLDAETARELFGSTEVIGSEVECAGRRLTVRGILEGEKGLLVIRPGEEERTDRITLEDISSSECESFLMRYGISGTAVSGAFLGEILQIFLFLFPVCLVLRFFRSLKGGRADVLRWILLLVLLYLLLRLLEIPETMIPDKWSNFQFWREWWESAESHAAAYMAQEKTGKEMGQIVLFLKGVLCSMVPVVLWEKNGRKILG